jgi:2'-5' RNA ligase
MWLITVGVSHTIQRMANDHFKTNLWEPDEVDWHFLITLHDQHHMRSIVEHYAHLYRHPGLYPPVPFEWLHMTIVRIGSVTAITHEAMTDVVDHLRPILAQTKLPELLLGPWWLWTGSVVLHVTPEEPITRLFNAVMTALATVLGEKAPKRSEFIPHVTLAYARTYQQELEVHQQLSAQWVDPIPVRIQALSLVKEKQTIPFYSWDGVTDIPIGAQCQSKSTGWDHITPWRERPPSRRQLVSEDGQAGQAFERRRTAL